MAWQVACQSSSTSGGPHPLSPTSVVSMRHLLLRLPVSDPRSQRQLTSSFPNNRSGEVCRELRLHHWPRLHVLFSVSNFHRVMVVYHDETSEAFHYHEPTSFLQALYHHMTGSPSFCWFAKSLSALINLSQNSLRRSVRSKHFCFSAVHAVLSKRRL